MWAIGSIKEDYLGYGLGAPVSVCTTHANAPGSPDVSRTRKPKSDHLGTGGYRSIHTTHALRKHSLVGGVGRTGTRRRYTGEKSTNKKKTERGGQKRDPIATTSTIITEETGRRRDIRRRGQLRRCSAALICCSPAQPVCIRLSCPSGPLLMKAFLSPLSRLSYLDV